MKIINANLYDTPFLAIDQDVVNHNIQQLIELFGGTERLRPHVKTHKSPDIVKLLVAAGIHKFKCATIAEAEMIAVSGGSDILLAYAVLGSKIDRFIELVIKYPDVKFSCLVAHQQNAQELATAAGKASIIVNVLIDLNVGMNRTGIHPDNAVTLYTYCSALPHLQVNGLHAYDGHLTDPDAKLRLQQTAQGFDQVHQLIQALTALGHHVQTIVAGSTPTLNFYADQPDVECSPGTFIYWDQHYRERFSELPFKPAVTLFARVIDIPEDHIICLDLGYKAVSSEDSPEECVSFPYHADFKVHSQSEEHMLVEIGHPMLGLGEIIYALPYHIGRTCNLYRECLIIKDGQIDGRWPLISGER